MKCMQTNFGGYSLSGFGDFSAFLLPSKMAKFPFQTIDYVHGGQKMESVPNFMQVEVDVKCIQTDIGGCDLSGFGDFATFMLPSKQPKFPF